MKATNVVLALLFALFTYFQFNDPDAWLWIGIYGLMTVIAALAATGRSYLPLIGITALACLYTLVTTAPGVWEYLTNQEGYTIMQGMSYDKPYIEETREFGGSLICLGALTYFYLTSRKARSSR
jgi:hypothetical protein